MHKITMYNKVAPEIFGSDLTASHDCRLKACISCMRTNTQYEEILMNRGFKDRVLLTIFVFQTLLTHMKGKTIFYMFWESAGSSFNKTSEELANWFFIFNKVMGTTWILQKRSPRGQHPGAFKYIIYFRELSNSVPANVVTRLPSVFICWRSSA